MRKTIEEHEICFGIPFQTWLVILTVFAIGLIHTMSVRPAAAMPCRTAVSVPGGKLALADKPDRDYRSTKRHSTVTELTAFRSTLVYDSAAYLTAPGRI
jgi:hypothetical protein